VRFFHFYSYLISNLFRNGRRKSSYGPQDYANDIGSLIKVMETDPAIKNKSMLIAPSVSGIGWTPEQVWNTGFINAYSAHLSALAVER
jgi:hypothetical protein